MCVFLGLNRSRFYYKKRDRTKQLQITQLFEEIPIYGAAKVHQQLLEENIQVSLNTVASYRQEMKLHTVLAVKQAPMPSLRLNRTRNAATSCEGLKLTRRNRLGMPTKGVNITVTFRHTA